MRATAAQRCCSIRCGLALLGIEDADSIAIDPHKMVLHSSHGCATLGSLHFPEPDFGGVRGSHRNKGVSQAGI